VINGDQDSVSGYDLGDPDLATRGQIDDVKQPRVARITRQKIATRGQKAAVVDLDTVRRKRQESQQPELATRGQKTLTKKGRSGAGKPYVEAVGASVGTIAFRLRWRENGKRMPPIYLSRVSKEVFEIIKAGNYEAFKEQLVSSHSAGSVRAGNAA
jgi:hypothetical protein